MIRLILVALLLAASVAHADCLSMAGSTSGSSQLCSQSGAGSATPFNLPTTTGSNNNVLTTDGSGNASWTATPTLTGTNFTGIAAGTALTGQVTKANGGTASTTGGAAAATLSLPYVVCNPTLTSVTGTGTETKIATCQVPANTVGTIGRLEVIYYGTTNSSSNNKNHTIRWGPNNSTADTACGTVTNANSTTNLSIFLHPMLVGTGATNTNQCNQPVNNQGLLTAGTTDTAMAVDTTATTYVNVTCTLANTGDSCTALNMKVIAYPGTGGN